MIVDYSGSSSVFVGSPLAFPDVVPTTPPPTVGNPTNETEYLGGQGSNVISIGGSTQTPPPSGV